MSAEQKELVKKVRAQISRRYIDTSLLNVTVNGASVHMTGVIKVLRTYPNVDLPAEMEKISQILRTIPGIRDVVWDVSQRT